MNFKNSQAAADASGRACRERRDVDLILAYEVARSRYGVHVRPVAAEDRVAA
jgi:hypothetical protein